VENKTYPTDDIQTFVKDQLQELQANMLKYEEAVTEGREAQQSNDVLRQQMEAQQQHILRLDEQMEGHRQSEEDLKARSALLERDLNDAKDLVHDHSADPLELEQGILDLRQQLKKSEEERKAACAKLDELEQLRQQHEQKIRDCEVGPILSRRVHH
jgi:chromosome segregation ATPase